MYDGSVIEIALDEGNYIHDADRPEQVNLNDDCVALRDIQVGERLYMNYSSFFYDEAEPIEWFEALKNKAFARTSKRLGGPSSSPSRSNTAFLDKQQQPRRLSLEGQSSSTSPLFFPAATVALVVAMLAMKSIVVGQNGRNNKNKNKLS
jgi:hypothetical protein